MFFVVKHTEKFNTFSSFPTYWMTYKYTEILKYA